MSREQENVELVRQAYAAIARGDIPGLIAMMTEDVEVELPGPSEIPFAGTFRGPDGVGRFFQAIATSADAEGLEPREFIAQGDRVVVLGAEQLTAKETGRSWDTEWAMVWTVRDGKIARLREYHETGAIAAAFRT